MNPRAPVPSVARGAAASAFHEGERAVQERAGVREKIAGPGLRMIRDFMPDEHRELFERLPYVVVGAQDGAGAPWATILAGAPGLMVTPDARTIVVRARPLAGDPAAPLLAEGERAALLGIELATRRRNRVNGRVVAANERGFAVEVDQSFGNCPQYIQRRAFAPQGDARRPARAYAEGALLSDEALDAIARADTFFIASASRRAADAADRDRREGLDVSHRGGRSGFVRATVEDGATVLTWPDFRGNYMFNTLGNLAVEPRAGIVVPDFARGALLTLTGRADVVWSGAELAAFRGAERLVRLRVASGARLDGAIPPSLDKEDAPQLAKTGSWADVAAALAEGDAPR